MATLPLLALLLTSQMLAPVQEEDPANKAKTLIFAFEIKDNIAAPTWRITKEAMDEAARIKADLVILEMNTYGGEVSAADSIRTRLLNASMPVYVFINDNAASAGALIAIACDSIYMKPGGKIGAATVVNQTGEQVPDKYQSYMRATMRATAEAHGQDTIVRGGDTLLVWHRNPAIAEAMVDPRLYVPGVSDTGQVLTFTASEAMRHGYCEGQVESVEDLIKELGIQSYELKQYEPTGLDKIIGFLINPVVSGLLIMLIIGGIYFELQSPGIGFALGAAVLAALLYFAPLYLEGLAENWELAVFLAGIVLILVEVFAIPGFGVAGITGIIAVVLGLTLALVDNVVFKDPELSGEGLNLLMRALGIVLISILLGLIGSLWAARKLLTSRALPAFALHNEQRLEDGFVGVETAQKKLIGATGIAHTVLRPSGKVLIGEKFYDAMSEYGFIDKGQPIQVIRYEAGQVYVTKAADKHPDASNRPGT